MGSFDDPIGLILKHEGGYVNHKNDRGGPTNFGITQRTLSGWLGRPASIEDVKQLTEAEARRIYEQQYLTGPGIDRLPDPPRTFVLDCAVNHGPGRAVRMLQRTLNRLGFAVGAVDGKLGPKTRAATETAISGLGNGLVNALVDTRVNFFKRIVERDPSQAVFLKGWLRRAESFRIT